MLSLFLFIGCALILFLEGRMVASLLAGQHLTAREKWALGFSLGAFINALIFFLFTILSVPLTFWTVFGAHGVLTVSLALIGPGRVYASSMLSMTRPVGSKWRKALLAILLFSIVIKLGYGASQALLYPSYYYDTISQWNMRAKISYEDQAIAFDRDELRGLSKPQYPILLHSLQIFFMLSQDEWHDTVANASTLLLSLSGLAAFLFVLSRRNGLFFGVLSLSLLMMIPLVAEHLRQGQGDIHMLTMLLLSAVLLLRYHDDRAASVLLLSALFAAEAAWIKIEGFIFVVLPFLFIIGALFVQSSNVERRALVLRGMLPAFLAGGVWIAFLLFKELPLSPHGGGDVRFEWHGEALWEALRALFASGSFGVHWYAVVVALGFGFRFGRKKLLQQCVPELMICLWGFVMLLIALFIFLATPNVAFLLNAQTFSRTMLLPLSLFILGMVLLLQQILEKCHPELVEG
jgi:hypothetical protein